MAEGGEAFVGCDDYSCALWLSVSLLSLKMRGGIAIELERDGGVVKSLDKRYWDSGGTYDYQTDESSCDSSF